MKERGSLVKKYLNTYSKIHQIASAEGKLASKINENSPARKFLLSKMWPAETSKKNRFLLLTPKVMVSMVSMMTYKKREVWG